MEPEGAPEPKRRKTQKLPPRRTVSSPASKTPKDAKLMSNLMVPGEQPSSICFKNQEAKNFAVAQAQQDGCTGNFKTFDSEYGNFMVPVVPSRAELNG